MFLIMLLVSLWVRVCVYLSKIDFGRCVIVVGRVELRCPQLKVAGMELMKVHILIHFRDSVPLNCDEARVAQDILLLMRILETLSWKMAREDVDQHTS